MPRTATDKPRLQPHIIAEKTAIAITAAKLASELRRAGKGAK